MITILVAEDEAPIREFVASVLADAGYHVLCARNGAEALELAQSTRPALVITDLMMPHMNGRELRERIRAAFPNASIPVVMMSASGVDQLRGSGTDAILPKPFDLDELLRLVMRYVGPADTCP